MQKISQSELSQAILRNDFKTASSLLPSKINQVFEQPKVREMIQAIGEVPVKLMLEFELIQLAALMSVGGNLNKAQVLFIAEQLIGLYPNESLADFKLCFRKGAIGAFGDIQRLDGITIGNWMKLYLNEKYEAVENSLMAEKENYYKPVEVQPSDIDWHQKWLDELPAYQSNYQMSADEIKKTGQEKPVKEIHRSTDEVYFREQTERLYAFQEQTVRERHPEWSEEQILNRLAELKSQTTNSTNVQKLTGGKF